MAKVKTSYFCQSCGTETSKWMGKCPGCNDWNTLVEEVIQREKKGGFSVPGKSSSPKVLSEITLQSHPRIPMKDPEFHRVLGNGLTPGSLTLIGGEPGIGKSTLLLQIALEQTGVKTLYISGEESEQQIKMRADRIGVSHDNCYVLSETAIAVIFKQIALVQPEFVVIDSIQTLYAEEIESTPGSISQIRECTAQLLKYAKETGVPVVLIGHITKDGAIAGPKVLEHMVDTVLQFEGDRNHVYRLLRSVKNRFGSTNEIGIYQMEGSGLRPVENPSEILISNTDENLSGVAIAATQEGMRPMLVEVQALVSTAAYGTPQRSSTGFDLRRLNMLLAVLEKRCGFRLSIKDVFLNITGGVRVDDPAIDLAVVSAVLSSNEDVPVKPNVCLAAEVGLSGEIRPVPRVDQRILEAEKLGYDAIVVSKYNKGLKDADYKIQVVQVGKIEEVFQVLFA
jgi:DNA repair protein RadA/Sms